MEKLETLEPVVERCARAYVIMGMGLLLVLMKLDEFPKVLPGPRVARWAAGGTHTRTQWKSSRPFPQQPTR